MFKNKMTMKEKQKQDIYNFMQMSNETAIKTKMSEIFDDEKSLMDSAEMTQEYLRARALFDGKISMKYDGGSIDVKYGYRTPQDADGNEVSWREDPKANQFVLAGGDIWGQTTTDLIEQIIEWADRCEERTGLRPDEIWMNNTTFRKIKENTEISGELATLKLNKLSSSVWKEYIEQTSGIKIKIYNKKLIVDGKTKDLIEDGKVVLVPSGKSLGNLMIGTSPSEFNKSEISKQADVTVTGSGIAVSKWATVDPVQLYTAVEMVCLPSFPQIEYATAVTVFQPRNARAYSAEAKKVETKAKKK